MQDFLFLKVDKFQLKFKYSEIIYIKAEKKCVIIVTPSKKHISLASISEVEKKLPKRLFCRVHRSYIISLEHLTKFDNEIAYVGNNKLPIAKHFKNELKKATTVNSE